jgi:DUF4097 and DUF4098 domain-containing protein YvlB
MRITRTLFAASLFLAAAAQAAVESPIQKSFSVAPGGTLYLETDVGDVKIKTGGSGVTVDVKRRARTTEIMNDFDITLDQSGNDVTVRAKYQREKTKWFNWTNGNEIDATFTITVPSNYNLQVSTAGGDVEIADLTGEIRARTSGGDIEMGDMRGAVDARTSGGNVRLESATGRVDLRTSGGNIRLGTADANVQVRTSGGSIEVGRVTGDLYAHTSGGGIDIEEAGGAVDAETSGGSIRARMTQQPRTDSRLSTSGGGIVLTLASNVSLDLDARTSGGDVDTEIPITIFGKKSEGTLEGKINGGGPRLVLRSSGGGIRVKKQ